MTCRTLTTALGAATLALVLSTPLAADAKIRGLPPEATEKVAATEADIAELDEATAALIEEMRADAPLVVNYAERAAAGLVFPHVESSSFILGETSALGVLFSRDAGGSYQKSGYYRAARGEIGFGGGSDAKSVILLFMTETALSDFRAGKRDLDVQTVDVTSGKIISGPATADTAAFLTTTTGVTRGLDLKGVTIEPIQPGS